MFVFIAALWLVVWLAAPPPAPPTSVALHRDEVVVGTQAGLYRKDSGGWSLVLTRGGVRDLARSDERLLIATAAGLYAWEGAVDRPARIPLGAGARVSSVASDSERNEWVATEAGLFRRAAGSPVFRRETSLPPGAVAAVRASSSRVWIGMGGAVWQRPQRREGAAFERALRGLAEGWWELRGVVELEDGALLCVPRGLWRLDGGSPRRIELGIGELRAMVRVGSTLWVASSRGAYPFSLDLLESQAPEAVLHADAVDLLRVDDRLLVATRNGVASLSLGVDRSSALALRSMPETPDIQSVQRAVLAYLQLSPSRWARLEERARRAPWIPELRAGLSLDRDRTRDTDHDETFSSGQIRQLLDSSRSRDRNVSLDVTLVWELDRAATPDMAIDISRERRLLIELRDQVLERVNRLYFERLRVLTRLAAPEGDEPAAEAVELQIRARELAAQLDAWTGGAYSRLASRERSRPPK